jgi:hypothetical protein
VFEVSATADRGYQAGNTSSGSRLNSSLKDTSAPVMVFTPEFLSDFNSNGLADIIGYAPNMQIDMLDTSADANPQFIGGSDLTDTRIRVRGLAASTALDFFETSIAIDTYNTERLELSSGPQLDSVRLRAVRRPRQRHDQERQLAPPAHGDAPAVWRVELRAL